MSELKVRPYTMLPSGQCYDKSEVDAAIDELKEKIDGQKWRGDEWARAANDKEKQIAELKDENRKLKRALWLDRAIRAEHMKNLIFEGELIYHDDNYEELDWRIMYRKWERAETACLAKAKEYE